MIETIKKSLIGGIVFAFSALTVFGIVYAVNSGEPLTSTMWNTLVTRVDNLENNSNDKSYYYMYTGVDRDTPQILLGKDGNELGGDIIMRLFCGISGTSADGTSEWLIKKDYNGVHILKTASFSTTGNTPEIYNDAGTVKIRLYTQMNYGYSVQCYHEHLWK